MLQRLVNSLFKKKREMFIGDLETNVFAVIAGNGTAGGANGAMKDATFNYPIGLTVDGSENVYVADMNNHVIRKITSSIGKVETYCGVVGTSGSSDGAIGSSTFTNPMDVAIDEEGNLLIVDNGNKCIRLVTVDGVVSTIGKGSFMEPACIALIPYTNRAFVTDFGAHKIMEIDDYKSTTPNVSVYAGSGLQQTLDGPLIMASFNGPFGITFNPDNLKVYISESYSHCIRELDMESNIVSTYCGTLEQPGFADGSKDKASFRMPSGISSAREGMMYVCDSGNNAIRIINTRSHDVDTITPKGSSEVLALKAPLGIVCGWYAIYIADSENNMLREAFYDKNAGKTRVVQALVPEPEMLYGHGNFPEITVKTDFLISTIAGSGQYGSKDGNGISASLGYCRGMAIDANGNVYFCNQNHNQVKKMTRDGIVTTVAGNGMWGNVDGRASEARFRTPVSVTCNDIGTLYVMDVYGFVRKIENGIVSTVAGNGGFGHRDGPAKQALFAHAHGIDMDAQGNLYIADFHNHRIRLINKNGMVSTLAGNGTYGNANGNALTSSFMHPVGVAVDRTTNDVYVLEWGGHRVRKIADGIVSNFSGSGARGYKDGPPGTAMFHYPQHIHVDKESIVYVSDHGNNALRKIKSDGTAETIVFSKRKNYRDGPSKEALFAGIIACVYDNITNSFYVSDWENFRIRNIKASVNISYDLVPILEVDASKISANGQINMINIPNHGRLGNNFAFRGCKFVDDGGNRYISLNTRFRSHIHYNHWLQLDTFHMYDGSMDGITAFFVVQMDGNNVWERFMDFGRGAHFDNIVFARHGGSTQAAVWLANWNRHLSMVTTPNNTVDKGWHVYAFCLKNGPLQHNIRIFKDGAIPVVNVMRNGTIHNRWTNNNFFGRSNWGNDPHANMNIKQISVYDVAMSDEEIKDKIQALKFKWNF